MSNVTDAESSGLPIPHNPFGGGHGEAALLLVESLIHALIGRSLLSVDEAIAIVQIAIDASEEIRKEGLGPAASGDLLSRISKSLQIDADGDGVGMPSG